MLRVLRIQLILSIPDKRMQALESPQSLVHSSLFLWTKLDMHHQIYINRIGRFVRLPAHGA